jgi:hypothetical protein
LRSWSSVERLVFRAVTLSRQCRRPVFHLCHRPGFRRKLAPSTTGSRAQPLRRKRCTSAATQKGYNCDFVRISKKSFVHLCFQNFARKI